MSLSLHVVSVLYSCPLTGCFKDNEKKNQGRKKNFLPYQEGKKIIIAKLWRCSSKMLYRLLTHTNRGLHKASRSASVAFSDASVNCPSSYSGLLSSSYHLPASVVPPLSILHAFLSHSLPNFPSYFLQYLLLSGYLYLSPDSKSSSKCCRSEVES